MAKEHQARTHNQAQFEFLTVNRFSNVRYTRLCWRNCVKCSLRRHLLGRQRGPGLGYWSTGNAPDAIGPLSPASSRPPGSSRPDSAVVKSHDEEVNLEYLRNVIFQFLEHKEMRVRLLWIRLINKH